MAHVANVTIQSSKVAANLTDFPVYVNLADMPGRFWATVANGGGDIRVYKSDGTTELAREVVSCNTSTETGELHVKFTGTLSGSTDTLIQIHADGTSADYAVTDTYGRNAVWSDYVGVFHLNEASGNLVNATGKGDLTASGTATYGATGKLGVGIDFNGSNNYFSGAPTGAGTTEPVTMQGWMAPDELKNQSPFGLWGSTTANQMGVLLDDDDANFGTPEAYAATALANSSVALDGSLQMVHAVFASDTSRIIYVDGTSTGTNTTNVSVGSTTTFTIGRRFNDQYFAGILDEVRLRNATLSADWITTEFNNQDDTETFYVAESPVSYSMSADVGEFRIRGFAVNFSKIILTVALETGVFILTGAAALFTKGRFGWRNQDKEDSDWTNQQK
jgi:hypothetical protein